MKGVKRVVTL